MTGGNTVLSAYLYNFSGPSAIHGDDLPCEIVGRMGKL